MWLGSLVPVLRVRGHRWGQALKLVVILAWCVAIYVPMVKLIAADAWRTLLARIVGLYRGRVAGE